MAKDKTHQTVQAKGTESEIRGINMIAHATGVAKSPWIAGLIGAMLASKAGFERALADMDTIVERRGPHTRGLDLGFYTTSRITNEMHARLNAVCVRSGVKMSPLISAHAIMSAERALASRHPSADDKYLPEQGVVRALMSLQAGYEAARQLPYDRYMQASLRVREAVMRRGSVDRGTAAKCERELGMLTRELRDIVMRVGGWTGLRPLEVYVAAHNKARESDPQAHPERDLTAQV